MFIDCSKYAGKCDCGRVHTMETRAAVIEPGCLFEFEKYMAQFGVTGKRCALYGENSYAATADRHPRAEQKIVLDPTGLHANEISTAEVLAKLEGDVEVIVAVGSGTIHDIARFCAHERGIRFVSCPTGASVDGFCSNDVVWLQKDAARRRAGDSAGRHGDHQERSHGARAQRRGRHYGEIHRPCRLENCARPH